MLFFLRAVRIFCDPRLTRLYPTQSRWAAARFLASIWEG